MDRADRGDLRAVARQKGPRGGGPPRREEKVAERPKEVADGRAADVQTSTAGYSEGPDLEATGGEGGIRTPGTGFSPVQQISNLPCSATPAPLRNHLRGPSGVVVTR